MITNILFLCSFFLFSLFELGDANLKTAKNIELFISIVDKNCFVFLLITMIQGGEPNKEKFRFN